MPLYTDANYYYSGGSSQLYSPYYPGSSSIIPSASSSIYSPYTSTYNRAIGGSYVVPITSTRSTGYISPHSLSASRYQPKLSTITETSPLISSSRHNALMPLTRIQSPKYSGYAASNHVHTPKYIPPRPILINTADIDVSANRYRKRKEETLKQAQREAGYSSPSASIKRRNSTERKEEEEQRLRNEVAGREAVAEAAKDAKAEQPLNRSTIKRDRAVVRLSTIRSRSKDRKKIKTEDSSPEPEKKFKGLASCEPSEQAPLKWRDKLAEDLDAMPSHANKKSPGEILREKYFIEDCSALSKKQEPKPGMPKQTIEEVIVELDPLHQTVKRLSMPQCPTFHDICEDISSDKIDDDLNAGELRRRASIIQCQEKELLNELQRSASGTFQMITMERRGSHDSVDELPHQRHSKRSSKKGRKVRTKITAIVGVENGTTLGTILQANEDELDAQKSPRLKLTANVESVQEHHEIHKVFKLPKKKSIKRAAKIKERKLPEGFMSSLPKPQSSPKNKFATSTAEIFTFDQTLIEQTAREKTLESEDQPIIRDTKVVDPRSLAGKDLRNENKSKTEPLQTSQSVEDFPAKKNDTLKPLEKSSSLNIELKSPTLPKTLFTQEHVPQPPQNLVKELPKTVVNKSSQDSPKVLSSADEIIAKPTSNKVSVPSSPLTGNVKKGPAEKIALKTSQSLDALAKTKFDKSLEKSSSLNIELKSPTTPKIPLPETIKEESTDIKVATPKPIHKSLVKSDSGEDFWAQIGSRETLYMNKRKQELLESQLKKQSDLVKSINKQEAENSNETTALEISQYTETLKKVDENSKKSEVAVFRSTSSDSALKKTEDKKYPENDNKNTKVSKFPPAKMDDVPKTPVTPKDFKSCEGKVKTNVKSEIVKTPAITKMTTETSLLTSSKSTSTSLPSSPVTKSVSTTGTSSTTTSPKINGQPAKSPEQQESAEKKSKFFPTPPAKSNNNKNEIDINKTTAINEKQQQLAKAFTLPKENIKLASATSAVKKSASEATTTKQPETKQVSKTTTTPERNNAVVKPKTTDTDTDTATATDSKSEPFGANNEQNDTKSAIQTNAKTITKTSPSAINADQFIAKVPAKTNASPVKVATKTPLPATTPSGTSSNIAPTKKTPDEKKTTTTTSISETSASDTATTTSAKAATNADDNQQICNEIKDKTKADTNTSTSTGISTSTNNKNNGSDETNNSSTCGGNLSKFATVSNLAQCLHDVDADLADYLPSSAEISENEEDYKTDDSDFDYSSIDGWEKLTPSMKKKVKQRRRKEKQAEQARFDPQKKVKIDTTRKLYVKDEAPRFPLVATPRPLWKREKIIYPDEDSDDESDSEESGSTEDTEDSDECTTSEEYEDELNPTSSADVKSDSGTSGNGGISDKNKDSSIIRTSTCSNDSGFDGGTAPSSPKKMLECDVNCHKKCERLTANLCGVNQKLIVEALANVKRGGRETQDSPSTPPSSNPDYKIEAIDEQSETSYTYSQFQKSGRFTPPATIIPRFKNYTVDDFHFLAVLGKGSFGKVLLAELRDTTYYYAVKCLKKDVVLEDDDVDSTLIERKVLALGTKHPYLCHLFCTFQTESHLFFVMEYLNGGDLMFHIQESGRFTEERARFYGAEIVSGLKFLHKKGIIYRDLKLDNVLLDYEGHVRIADFGMCKLQIYLDKTADSFCGTPDYMAPEIIKGDKYNQNVDWWSFGVLLYEMLIGQSPFSGCDEDELFWSICNELPWFPVYISAEATSILKGLLEKDYTKRVGSQYSPAGDIVEHIFFRPIDWNLLEKRQIEPPFRPQVKHPLDTQYFDRVFTRERVRLTPIDKDILQSMDQKQFLGFTYTNPHITLD